MAIDITSILMGAGGAVIGALGTIGVALLNREPALEAAVNARIKAAFDSSDRQIADLSGEVKSLRTEAHELRTELGRAHVEIHELRMVLQMRERALPLSLGENYELANRIRGAGQADGDPADSG